MPEAILSAGEERALDAQRAEQAAFAAAVGRLVRLARAKRGATRRQLAEDSGASERYLAQIEGGQGNPSVIILKSIADALDIPIIELLPRSNGHAAAMNRAARLIALGESAILMDADLRPLRDRAHANLRTAYAAIAQRLADAQLLHPDVTAADVEAWVRSTEAELGPIDLLAANAGLSVRETAAWELEPEDWWHVLEVNVLGAYLSCRAVIPGMLERGRGRIVLTGSGAAYLPGSRNTAYSASKAALCRFGETLALQLAGHGIPVFFFSPGLVRTELTGDSFGDDARWTPPELAP